MGSSRIKCVNLFLYFASFLFFYAIKNADPAYLGSTVSIYCDIFNENNVPASIFWSRSSYDGTNLINYITSSLLPSNYDVENTKENSTYYVSTLTINGVTNADYATFICMSTAKVNLTYLAYPAFDPSTLCQNQTYNPVVYTLLLITNILLTIIMAFIVVCIWRGIPTFKSLNHRNIASANSTNTAASTRLDFNDKIDALDIIIAFSCFMIAFLLTILMLIFWISPTYAAPYGGNAYIYLSPLVIVPVSAVATVVLWVALLYYAIKTFITSKKEALDIVKIVVFGSIAFCHLFLVLVIICSVVYCSGRSTLPSSTNYSVASVVCAALMLALGLSLGGYVFWDYIHKTERLRSIGIFNRIGQYTSRKVQSANVNENNSVKRRATITDMGISPKKIVSGNNNDMRVENVEDSATARQETSRSTKSISTSLKRHSLQPGANEDNDELMTTDNETTTPQKKGKKGKKSAANKEEIANAIAPTTTTTNDDEEEANDGGGQQKKPKKKGKKAAKDGAAAAATDGDDAAAAAATEEGGPKKKKGKKAKAKAEDV